MRTLSLEAALVVLLGLVPPFVMTPARPSPDLSAGGPGVDQGPGAVLPGVALTWGSAFLCAGAPDPGTCEITVAALAATDEGRKATLHLLAHGHDVASGGPVDLGINLHLRAPGVQT